MRKVIGPFIKETEFLSNSYPSTIIYNGYEYPTVEHAFQATKTIKKQEIDWIAAAPTPGVARFRGERITLRDDWGQIKDNVMLELIRIKFSDPVLKRRLIETRDWELCEYNYLHDNYWGNCTCQKCTDEYGKNMLGKILMQVRDECISNILNN